jgi:hypothetical protein
MCPVHNCSQSNGVTAQLLIVNCKERYGHLSKWSGTKLYDSKERVTWSQKIIIQLLTLVQFKILALKVVTNEKAEAVGEVLTIIC